MKEDFSSNQASLKQFLKFSIEKLDDDGETEKSRVSKYKYKYGG